MTILPPQKNTLDHISNKPVYMCTYVPINEGSKCYPVPVELFIISICA